METHYFRVVFVASVLVAIVSCQTCTDNGQCVALGGQCQLKTAVCNGIPWNKGCKNASCLCCLPATVTQCISKPWCTTLGGTCQSASTSCTSMVAVSKGCRTASCFCCVPKIITGSGCLDNGECYSRYGGYCFTKGVHPCKGIQWDGGCSGTTCSCCVLGESTCVTKQLCKNNGGTCVSPAACTKPNRNPNWCLGTGCTCCY